MLFLFHYVSLPESVGSAKFARGYEVKAGFIIRYHKTCHTAHSVFQKLKAHRGAGACYYNIRIFSKFQKSGHSLIDKSASRYQRKI